MPTLCVVGLKELIVRPTQEVVIHACVILAGGEQDGEDSHFGFVAVMTQKIHRSMFMNPSLAQIPHVYEGSVPYSTFAVCPRSSW